MRVLDYVGRRRKKNSGIRKRMSQEATTNLLQRQKNERVCEGPNNNLGQIPRTSPSHSKLVWYGHIVRHDSLSKAILQGALEGMCCRGQPCKSWGANVKEWTDLKLPELAVTKERGRWRTTAAAASHQSPRRPSKVVGVK